jgi:hypothetical protein
MQRRIRATPAPPHRDPDTPDQTISDYVPLFDDADATEVGRRIANVQMCCHQK